MILLQGCSARTSIAPRPRLHLLVSGAPGSSFSLALVWLPSPPKEPWGSSWSQSTPSLSEKADPCSGLTHLPAPPLPCPPQGGRGSGLLRKLRRQLLCHSILRLLPGWKVLCDYAWLPINRNLSAPAAVILAPSFSPLGENQAVFRRVFFAGMYRIAQITAQINQ